MQDMFWMFKNKVFAWGIAGGGGGGGIPLHLEKERFLASQSNIHLPNISVF